MVGDLFSRTLENADSITAEELKLASLEKSEDKSKSQKASDEEKSEKTGDRAVNENQQNDNEVKAKLEDNEHVVEKTIKNESTSVSNNDNDECGRSKGDRSRSSSEYESHSSESSETDSSSSGEEEDEEDENIEDNKEIYGADEYEDEDERFNSNEPIRSKNEIIEEQIIEVPENYRIDEKTKISEIGIIKSVFEFNVIVQGTTSGEKRVLKEGSIFCLENREVVGTLSEVFGQLQNPFYKVGISPVNETKNEIIAKIKEMIGSKIFIVVPDAHWIDTFELKRVKGTDASNGYDEELPEEEQEFSDDEKEAQFKRMMKNQKKKKKNTSAMADNNKKKDGSNNTNKITKKKQPTSYRDHTMYPKMTVPIGMVQQNYYTSRLNRQKDSNNDNNEHEVDIKNTNNNSNVTLNNNINNKYSELHYQNKPVFPNSHQDMYQSIANQYGPMAPQGQYNVNNYNRNYQQPFMQNSNLYLPQQYNSGNFDVLQGGMNAQGYANVNYTGQFSGYNSDYNIQYNYSNHYTQFHLQQQQHLYNQNPNVYYQQNLQQAYASQHQQQVPSPSSTTAHTSNIDQVRNFHEMLLKQNTSENANNLSPQNKDTQTNKNNDIPY